MRRREQTKALQLQKPGPWSPAPTMTPGRRDAIRNRSHQPGQGGLLGGLHPLNAGTITIIVNGFKRSTTTSLVVPTKTSHRLPLRPF